MNLAFYSCFYGSNNNPSFIIPELPSLKYNCYFYTNNTQLFENLKKTEWIGIFDNNPTNDDLIESCMVGKHVKTSPHEYKELQDYDYTCFLDSKLQKVNELFVEDFIKDFFIKKDYALLLREHTFIHNNIWNEFKISMKQKRYVIENEKYKKYINKQINNGLKESTKTHCMCGFLIRNMRHYKIKEINNKWYEHIQECGIQDQISFFFVKQLFDEHILSFKNNPFMPNIVG